MTKAIRKGLLLTLKLAVAAGLLLVVLRQVDWYDYVTTYSVKKVSVLALRSGPGGQEVQTARGAAFVPLRSFRPITIRLPNGVATVEKAIPSWEVATSYEIKFSDGQIHPPVDAATMAGAGVEYIKPGFRTAIVHANRLLLLAAAGCFVLPVLIMSVRFWYLLKIQQIFVTRWEAVRLTFLGQFFSFVVPGTVSGDLVKAYYVARHTERKAAVLVTVFVDRAVGLLEFAILPAAVMLAMLVGGVNMARFFWPAITVAVVVLLVAASAGFLFSSRLRRLMGGKWILSKLPIKKHMLVLAQAVYLYRQEAVALFKALAITFGGQFFFIVAILIAGEAIGLGVSWYQYFLYVPLIYIVAAVPISPGGLGVTEVLYVFFFSSAGVAASQIMALAVVARVIPMLVSLPGLAVALMGPRLPKAAEMKAELGS